MNKKLNCILLIDDDEPTNFLNKMTVEQADCAHYVQIVQSGQEALDFLQRKGKYQDGSDCPHPDLIFLDINMPAMSGWEFMDHYKDLPDEQKGKVVVIMLTTSLNPDDEARTHEISEISGFEHKPLNVLQLEAVLEKYFS